MAMTEAQKKAQRKYRKKNKEKQRYWVAKSTANKFVETASEQDLKELQEKIVKRLARI